MASLELSHGSLPQGRTCWLHATHALASTPSASGRCAAGLSGCRRRRAQPAISPRPSASRAVPRVAVESTHSRCGSRPAPCLDRSKSSLQSAPAAWARSTGPATPGSHDRLPSRCCRKMSVATTRSAGGSRSKRARSRRSPTRISARSTTSARRATSSTW